ncbi:hypothetical protein ACFLU2_03410 [Chloroflexota bacterium]
MRLTNDKTQGTMDECKRFEECSAQLCPMDNNDDHLWYPGEEICPLRRFASLDWVRKQKLIVKRCGSMYGFFNVKMLQAIRKVSKGLIGADPDKGIIAEKRWFKDRGL